MKFTLFLSHGQNLYVEYYVLFYENSNWYFTTNKSFFIFVLLNFFFGGGGFGRWRVRASASTIIHIILSTIFK